MSQKTFIPSFRNFCGMGITWLRYWNSCTVETEINNDNGVARTSKNLIVESAVFAHHNSYKFIGRLLMERLNNHAQNVHR
jgi:hypothetical protein